MTSLIPQTCFAVSVSVHLTREGTLAEKILEQTNSLATVTDLTVTGVMNEADWNCITVQLTAVTHVDMSGANASFTAINSCNRNITHIAFPSGIKTVGNGDYYNYSSLFGQSLSEVTFNEGLETIREYAFYETSLISVSLPQSLKNIGERAFSSCTQLREVTLPDNLTSISYRMFENCVSLQNITFPLSLATIGSYAFWGCITLTDITFPEGLSTIESNAFDRCTSLTNIVLPKGLSTIGSTAFWGCISLTDITFPEGLSTIASSTFSGCTSLSNITFPEGLSTIESRAFNGCTSLTELFFPESITTIGSEAFSNCSGLNKVTCLIPLPISLNNGIFSGFEKDNCTLYVPAWSALLYRMAIGWSEFTNIETVDTGSLHSLTISDSRYLPASIRPGGTPNVTVTPAGDFMVRGNAPFPMDTLTLNLQVEQGHYEWRPDENGNYHDYYIGEATGAVLLNDSANLSVNKARLGINSIGGKWSFVSFPFDVALSDITPVTATDEVNYVWKTYDGERRALVGSGGNWKEVTDTLYAGVGYIYQCQNTNSIYLTATAGSKNKVFSYDDVVVELKEYAANDTEDESWNYTGNPYATYFDTHYINFTAPITVWNGNGYDAVSLTDDNYILRPYEAFFIQKQTDTPALRFFSQGRKNKGNEQTYNSYYASALRSSAANTGTERTIVNLYLTGNNYEDKCRIVFNNSAFRNYELNCDAAKFISEQNGIPQIYTTDNGTAYAINERPLDDGIVALGVDINAAGDYAISLDKNCNLSDLYLYDKQENKITNLAERDYSFHSDEMSSQTRFEIKTAEQATEIAFIAPKAPVLSISDNVLTITNALNKNISIWTMDGRLVKNGLNQSFSTSITLPKGYYVVKVAEDVQKVVVY